VQKAFHYVEPGLHSESRSIIYIAHVPVGNALVLSNLREYRHKWYIATN